MTPADITAKGIDNVRASAYGKRMNNNDARSILTDGRLMEVTGHRAIVEAEKRGDRLYVALWADGDRTLFAVASAEHAQTYAREYGARFRGGDKPLRVVWAR